MTEIDIASQVRVVKSELQKSGDVDSNRRDAGNALNKMLDDASLNITDDRKFREYRINLQNGLNKSGLLTELAVVYAQENFKALDRDGKKGLHSETDLYGAIDRNARERASCSDGGHLQGESVCGPGGRGNTYHQMMLSELYRSHAALRMKDGHSNSGAIQKDDLDQYLKERENSRLHTADALRLIRSPGQHNPEERGCTAYEPMQHSPEERGCTAYEPMQHSPEERGCTAYGNGPSLFDVLDTAAKGGTGDGKISKGDLKAFVKQCDDQERQYSSDSVYNPANRRYVQDILDTWKDGLGKELRGDSDEITVKSLKKAFGLSDGSIRRPGDVERLLDADDRVARAERVADQKAELANDAAKRARELDELARKAEEKAELAEQLACKREAELKDLQNAKKPETHQSGPSEDILQLLKAKKGQGPWGAAQDLLGSEASPKEVLALSRKIRDAYEETHGGKGSAARIKPGERWLTDDQWRKIVNENEKFKGKYAS